MEYEYAKRLITGLEMEDISLFYIKKTSFTRHNEYTDDTIIEVSNVILIYESFFLSLIFMQLLVTVLVRVKRNSV